MMLSKIVRNIWTLGTLIITFLILRGWLSFPENPDFVKAISYNFFLISLYLYGKEGIKNAKPIIEMILNRGKNADAKTTDK